MEKIRIAILGTGPAGRAALEHQGFLDSINRQYAKISCVTASNRTAGRRLGDVIAEKEDALCKAYPFHIPRRCPGNLVDIVIDLTDPDLIAQKADYAISALGADVAKTIEPELTKRGVNVFSNSSAYRWKEDVPLLIPEANYHHIELVEKQEGPGIHVCNPNCTTAGYVPLIKALEDLGHEIVDIDLTTYQALSGKGDAIANPDYTKRIFGNVIDDWARDGKNMEEWKSACEPMKILGKVKTKEEVESERKKVVNGEQARIIPIYTQTARVLTQDGHLEKLTISFKHAVDINDIRQQLANYELPEQIAALPTTPDHLFYVLDRMPSPREDVYKGNGMGVVVGDLKQETPIRISIWTLTHNLRRGATWAGRQGLELYLREYKGMFK